MLYVSHMLAVSKLSLLAFIWEIRCRVDFVVPASWVGNPHYGRLSNSIEWTSIKGLEKYTSIRNWRKRNGLLLDILWQEQFYFAGMNNWIFITWQRAINSLYFEQCHITCYLCIFWINVPLFLNFKDRSVLDFLFWLNTWGSLWVLRDSYLLCKLVLGGSYAGCFGKNVMDR